MPSFFSRVASIFKSNANAVLDQLEDPEKLINQMIRDMETQLGQAKSGVAGAITAEKRLKKQMDENARQAELWEKRAMQAVEAGNDELARKALARKKEHADIVATMKPQWDTASQTAEKLKAQLRTLESKIDQAKRKRGTIIARQKAAEAQRKIQSTVAGLGKANAFDTFARMEEKVADMESQQEAHAELADEFNDDSLEKEFAGLDSSSIDDELAALKAKAAQ